jgi:hypothetical protein
VDEFGNILLAVHGKSALSEEDIAKVTKEKERRKEVGQGAGRDQKPLMDQGLPFPLPPSSIPLGSSTAWTWAARDFTSSTRSSISQVASNIRPSFFFSPLPFPRKKERMKQKFNLEKEKEKEKEKRGRKESPLQLFSADLSAGFFLPLCLARNVPCVGCDPLL